MLIHNNKQYEKYLEEINNLMAQDLFIHPKVNVFHCSRWLSENTKINIFSLTSLLQLRLFDLEWKSKILYRKFLFNVRKNIVAKCYNEGF
jgi:hypothetical protein